MHEGGQSAHGMAQTHILLDSQIRKFLFHHLFIAFLFGGGRTPFGRAMASFYAWKNQGPLPSNALIVGGGHKVYKN
jgi:hypothetical protein